MAVVGLAGYLIGFRHTPGKEYSVIDILQFGDQHTPTTLIPVLIYEVSIRDIIYQHFKLGQTKPISLIVKHSYNVKTKDVMWIAQKVIEVGHESESISFDLSQVDIVDKLGSTDLGGDEI